MDVFLTGLMSFLNAFGIVSLVLIMVVSWLGLVVPVFPGTVVMWVAMGVYGLVYGFGKTGLILFIIITVLMILSTFLDNFFMGAKALEKGASKWGIAISIIGGIIFSFIFPPLGGIIAAPLLLFLYEFWQSKDQKEALRITKGMLAGWGWSFVARFGVGFVMMGLWVTWFFANRG
jgi:uncharacterized protein YqgC (DUF456 family)